MNKISLAVAVLLLSLTGNASAANSLNTGVMGLNVSLSNTNTPADFMLNGRYLAAKDMALLAGFGLAMVDNAGKKHTDIGFTFGARKYMKTEDFAPFIGGKFQYMSTGTAAGDVTDLGFGVEAGAEYFVGKQFSVEGSVGFGYVSSETKTGVTTIKNTTLGTRSFSMGANFYF